MKTTGFTEAIGSARWKPAQLGLVVTVPLALAVMVSACENVATYTQPSLVRVIDASYVAPAANVSAGGVAIADNIGEGSITPYGTLAPTNSAAIDVTATTGGATLATASSPFLAGHQSSVFLTDSGGAVTITVLADQNVPAPSGQSAFRFLNQAAKAGAVDIYMVPPSTSSTTSGTTSTITLTGITPLIADVPVGSTPGYVSFPSQSVIMVITPARVTTPSYTSTPIALTGGEVRTVLILDAKVTSSTSGPFEVFTGNDFN